MQGVRCLMGRQLADICNSQAQSQWQGLNAQSCKLSGLEAWVVTSSAAFRSVASEKSLAAGSQACHRCCMTVTRQGFCL